MKNGEKYTAWKAGLIHGVYGHRTYAHKPCVQLITDGKLQCPYCADNVKLEWRGYVPLWDVDWCLRYVLIGEDVFESVDATDFRAPVLVTRAKNPISPLIVRPFATLERELPNRPPWDKPIDMLSICLTLWEHDELSKWYATRKPATSDNAVSLTKSNGEPFGPMTAAAARKYAPPPAVESAEKVLDKTLASLKEKAEKQSTNGNGKKH